jgi:hypothetical protein
MMDISDSDTRFWELAIATNAAFKGLLGSLGQSGHVCASTRALVKSLNIEIGWTALCALLAKLVDGLVDDGDTIVIADKLVAVAQGRIGPARVLSEPDPKTISHEQRASLAQRYQDELGILISPLHLLLADQYSGNRATLGALDHNQAAYDLAQSIACQCGRNVDVIVSDTDTGLDVRAPLIGCVTIGATPLGATAGLTLYEAMRCAVAAEFVRGHTRNIPVVICVPAERCRDRPRIGQVRGYPGALHIS